MKETTCLRNRVKRLDDLESRRERNSSVKYDRPTSRHCCLEVVGYCCGVTNGRRQPVTHSERRATSKVVSGMASSVSE